jgi:hypothetical protein
VGNYAQPSAPASLKLRGALSAPAMELLEERILVTDLDFLFEGIDEGERCARLRVLHALVAVYCGWDHPVKLARDAVVFDGAAPTEALALVARLPGLTRRRLLSSYGALTLKGW